MNIFVCVKQVPDTAEMKIDPVTNNLVRDGVTNIMNPYDQYALETALEIKDSMGAKVTVITMGPPHAESVLKDCLAVGADEAILVSDRAFGGADTLATSAALAEPSDILGFLISLCAAVRLLMVIRHRLVLKLLNIWICRRLRLP